jgi:hypothetical protein
MGISFLIDDGDPVFGGDAGSSVRLGQPGLRPHLSIARQHRGGGLVERCRRAADRHARYLRNVVVDVDRPDEAVAVGQLRQIHATDLKVIAPDDVVPAGRLVRPCRAAGVAHRRLGSTVQSIRVPRQPGAKVVTVRRDCKDDPDAAIDRHFAAHPEDRDANVVIFHFTG